MHSEAMNSIAEGIHRILPENCPRSTAETHRIIPLATINRGQNSLAIFQTTWEICDLGFDIEFDNGCGTFNSHQQVELPIQSTVKLFDGPVEQKRQMNEDEVNVHERGMNLTFHSCDLIE
jgi:hypothetical protein